MILTAVIPHFYESRLRSLESLVRSLQEGTRPPDRIVVWNNDVPFAPLPGVDVIQASQNLGSRARFLAAQQVTGDVLFLDNDLMVKPNTVREMIDWSAQLPNSVITLHGWQVDRSYARRTFTPSAEPQRVNVSLGRIELVPRPTVDKLLVGFTYAGMDTEMDDLWFSARARERDVAIWWVPSSGFHNFAEREGVGYCMSPSHYDRREQEFMRLFHVA